LRGLLEHPLERPLGLLSRQLTAVGNRLKLAMDADQRGTRVLQMKVRASPFGNAVESRLKVEHGSPLGPGTTCIGRCARNLEPLSRVAGVPAARKGRPEAAIPTGRASRRAPRTGPGPAPGRPAAQRAGHGVSRARTS